jgi:hypothetical protein
MRIRRRTAIVLAIAAAGALTTTGFALAASSSHTASNGNVSGVKFDFKPHKLPKKKFHKGTLLLGTSTSFAHPPDQPGGDVDRVQLWIDDDIKLNLNSVAKCDPASFSSNTTMAQAMAACGNAKVGKGLAHVAQTAGGFPGCVLTFNGTNKRIVLFTRIFASTPINCSDPRNNNGGDTSVTLFGKLKGASGDFGTQLDVNTTTTALPLGDFTSTIKRGKYATARCHDGNKKLNVKAKHSYNDGVKSTDKVFEKCKRS